MKDHRLWTSAEESRVPKKRKGRLVRAAGLLSLLLLLAAIATAAWFAKRQLSRLEEPYRGYSEAEQFVDVPSGVGPPAIGRLLVEAGVVRDITTWRVAVWRSGEATALKAGSYRFTDAMTPGAVVDRLARGEVYLREVTFPEGLTIRQMARVFETAGLGSSSAFVGAAQDGSLVSAFDPQAHDLEGYLFPDTYALPRRASAVDLVRRMVSRFEAALTDDVRRAAQDSGLSVRQLVTLASLIEKETANAGERTLVAAVYRNRLAKRMPLQCDPTVIYALELRGHFNGNLTRADLGVISPYNTYRAGGLPPGPIAAPGRASLEAAARPAPVDYLFFVSRNDGSHAFAATLREHNNNVQKYQVDFFRARAHAQTR
jgi:UPF0755 protein